MTVLGCSGSVVGPDSPASGYLITAPDTPPLVVDFGGGVLGALQRYADPNVVHVLLSHLHATTYSPGFAMVRTTYGPNAEMIMYNSAQPINRNETVMRWTLIVRREIEDAVGDDVMTHIIEGLNDDYPIWANKVHKHRPVFCKEDKTLVMFRKWVRQFYLTSKDKREIA